jgi:hypothetical protein
MRVTKKEKRKQYRIFFTVLNEYHRILPVNISKKTGIDRKTTSLRLEEAYEKGHIVGPHLRKKSYKNFIEYEYFVHCEDALESYLKYIEDQRISYHAVMDGFCNLWVVSKEKIIIEGDILVAGPRSDYHMSFPPDHSWDEAVQIMEKKVENFNEKKYEPEGIIKTHWDKPIEWDKEDELLFRKLKYDLRKPLTPIIKKFGTNTGKIEEWLKRLPETCNVLTSYFPNTISAYDPYIFMFKTDYEDFIIDLFSELPTSCLFFKVSGMLVLLAYMRRNLLRCIDHQPSSINKLQVPLLIRSLVKKGIVQKKDHAIVNYHWRKDI